MTSFTSRWTQASSCGRACLPRSALSTVLLVGRSTDKKKQKNAQAPHVLGSSAGHPKLVSNNLVLFWKRCCASSTLGTTWSSSKFWYFRVGFHFFLVLFTHLFVRFCTRSDVGKVSRGNTISTTMDQDMSHTTPMAAAPSRSPRPAANGCSVPPYSWNSTAKRFWGSSSSNYGIGWKKQLNIYTKRQDPSKRQKETHHTK